jgi:hypothetical protein
MEADVPTQPPELDRETERRLAAGLYNETWRLIELPARSPAQDDDLIHTAHASRYHWSRVGEAVNLARGEYLCSRVYAVLERPEPSVWHARRCLEILTEAGGGEDHDLAAAYEALARAYGVAGDREQMHDWLARAREAVEAIANPKDRRPIEEDIRSLG